MTNQIKTKAPKQVVVRQISEGIVTNDKKTTYKKILFKCLAGNDWLMYVRKDYGRYLYDSIKVGDIYTNVQLSDKGSRVNQLSSKLNTPLGNTKDWIDEGHKGSGVHCYRHSEKPEKTILIIPKTDNPGFKLVIFQDGSNIIPYTLSKVEILNKFCIFL